VKPDASAKAFIEANIDYYREVTLAVKAFEGEVKATLESIWNEFEQQLGKIGIPADLPSFKKGTEIDAPSCNSRPRDGTQDWRSGSLSTAVVWPSNSSLKRADKCFAT
jgi:hypothetical protein